VAMSRWLKSRYLPGPLILGYHRIANVSYDPQHLCVSPRNFAKQLDVLASLVKVVSLRELTADLLAGKSLLRTVAITFDDGYADTLYNAKPLLESYSAPATVFVATGFCGQEFWWNKLERMLYDVRVMPAKLCLNLSGKTFQWSDPQGASLAARNRLLKVLGDFFRLLSWSEQQEALEKLERCLPGIENPVLSARGMTHEELKRLASTRHIDIGAHTVTHCSLGGLTETAQYKELAESKELLEKITGAEVESCSYPNGSLSEITPAIVRDLGMTSACTSDEDVVAPSHCPYRLPRFWIRNWNDQQFAIWLRWWLQ